VEVPEQVATKMVSKMQTERFNFIVDKKTKQKFNEIMEQLEARNKNQTFIAMVSCFMKLHIQAKLFREFAEQALDHQELWIEEASK
jgi:hypothetical protein